MVGETHPTRTYAGLTIDSVITALWNGSHPHLRGADACPPATTAQRHPVSIHFPREPRGGGKEKSGLGGEQANWNRGPTCPSTADHLRFPRATQPPPPKPIF